MATDSNTVAFDDALRGVLLKCLFEQPDHRATWVELDSAVRAISGVVFSNQVFAATTDMMRQLRDEGCAEWLDEGGLFEWQLTAKQWLISERAKLDAGRSA